MPALHGAFCPACGEESLRMAAPGTGVPGLLCYNASCLRAEAAALILSDRETHHVVTFTEADFTIRHPLIERLDDALLKCDLHKVCKQMSGPPPGGPGRYRAERWATTRTGWYFREIAEPVLGAES